MTRNTTFLLTLGLSVMIWGVLFLAVEPLAERVSGFRLIKERVEELFAKGSSASFHSKESNLRAEGSPTPRLTSKLTALVNEPFSLYFDGVVSGKEPDSFLVEITSPTLSGEREGRRWTITPTDGQAGLHPLHVTVRDWNDAILAQQEVTFEVIRPPTLTKPLKILIIGDSLTRSTPYPLFLYERLESWAPGQIQLIGAQRTIAHDPNQEAIAACSRHESCNGWTWKLFASHYGPGLEERYALTRSPFVFLDDAQAVPRLDVARYLQEQGHAEGIDYVIFQLGLNETFGVNLNRHNALDKTIDKMFPWADKLIAAFREACPHVRIGVALPIPFTRSAASFAKTYGGMKERSKSNPWRSRQIQDRLVERMIAHFEQDPRVFLIPMNSTLDIIEGYNPKDAGHPNRIGCQQMADAVFLAILGQQSQLE